MLCQHEMWLMKNIPTWICDGCILGMDFKWRRGWATTQRANSSSYWGLTLRVWVLSINRPCGWWRKQTHKLLGCLAGTFSCQTTGLHCTKQMKRHFRSLTEWPGLLKSLAWVKILDSWGLWIHILHRLVHWFLLIWWWLGASLCSPLWRFFWG